MINIFKSLIVYFLESTILPKRNDEVRETESEMIIREFATGDINAR